MDRIDCDTSLSNPAASVQAAMDIISQISNRYAEDAHSSTAGGSHTGEAGQINDPNPFSIPKATDIQTLTNQLLKLAGKNVSDPSKRFSVADQLIDSRTSVSHSGFPTSPRLPLTQHVTHTVHSDVTDNTRVNISLQTSPIDQLNSSFNSVWSNTSPNVVTAFQNALAQLALLGLSSPSPTYNGQPATESKSSIPVQENVTFQFNSSEPKKQNLLPHSSPCSNHSKNKTDSKVTIRQIADADEHFFKALNRLAVNVPPDIHGKELKRMNGKNERCLSLDLTTESHSNSSTTHTLGSIETCSPNRTAADIAVDAHFEKSLGSLSAFPIGNKSPEMPTLHVSGAYGFCSDSNDRMQPDNNIVDGMIAKLLVRQYSQNDETLGNPIDCSTRSSPDFPQPPPYNSEHHFKSRTQYRNRQALLSRSDSSEKRDIQSLTSSSQSSMHSEKARKKNRPARLVLSPQLSTFTAAPSANTFKPKKNWLAQYGGDDTRLSDQSSSPVSPSHGYHRFNTFSDGISPNWIQENSNIHVDERIDSYQQSGSSTNSTTSKTNNGKFFFNKETNAARNVIRIVDNSQDLQEVQKVRFPTEQVRYANNHTAKCTSSPNNEAPWIKYNASINNTHNGANLNVEFKPPKLTKESNDRGTLSYELPVGSLNPQVSNSPSPSPAFEDGSSVSVTGTTSGFFSGSTYSLDSSLGSSQSYLYKLKDSDDNVAHKTAATDLGVTQTHNEATLMSVGNNEHSSLRKRASSEISPLSTLKRSRSVLTSPQVQNESSSPISFGSKELLAECWEERGTNDTSTLPYESNFIQSKLTSSQQTTVHLTNLLSKDTSIFDKRTCVAEKANIPPRINEKSWRTDSVRIDKAKSEPLCSSGNVRQLSRSLSDNTTLNSLQV